MLKLLNFFKKSLLAVAGLVVGLQIQTSSDVPTRRVTAWPQSTAAMVARPRVSPVPAPGATQPLTQRAYLEARVEALKSGAKTAGYSAEQQKELREAQKALKQAEKEEKAAQKQALKARKQANINQNIEKSKQNEQFRLEQEREQRAAIDREMQERREQRAYAAQQADPKFRAQRMALSKKNEQFRLADQEAQRRAIDQEILERQKVRAERAAQLERDRVELQAWADTYEKDLAAEQRDRALLYGRQFETQAPKGRYDQMLAAQEQGLVVSQATEMLRTLNQKEVDARAVIAQNSGMFSNLFASPAEQLMRSKRVEKAKADLYIILRTKEELDFALEQNSVEDQLAELEFVREKMEEREAAEREFAAQQLAEQMTTREPKAEKRQGQKSRYTAFGEYGEGAEQPEFASISEPTVSSEQPVAATEPFVAPEQGEGEEYKQAEQEAAADEREQTAIKNARILAETHGQRAEPNKQLPRSVAAFEEYGEGAEPAELNLLEPMAPGEGESMPVRVQMPAQEGQERRGADLLQEQEQMLAEQKEAAARERAAEEFGNALAEKRKPKVVKRQGQEKRGTYEPEIKEQESMWERFKNWLNPAAIPTEQEIGTHQAVHPASLTEEQKIAPEESAPVPPREPESTQQEKLPAPQPTEEIEAEQVGSEPVRSGTLAEFLQDEEGFKKAQKAAQRKETPIPVLPTPPTPRVVNPEGKSVGQWLEEGRQRTREEQELR